MREVTIENLSRPLRAPLRAGYCETFWCKLRGLMLRRELPERWGLLLVQERESRIASAIHMLGMRMALEIVWINAAREVVDVRRAYPWRSFLMPRGPAKYVLELAVEDVEGFQVGDKVRFEEVD